MFLQLILLSKIHNCMMTRRPSASSMRQLTLFECANQRLDVAVSTLALESQQAQQPQPPSDAPPADAAPACLGPDQMPASLFGRRSYTAKEKLQLARLARTSDPRSVALKHNVPFHTLQKWLRPVYLKRLQKDAKLVPLNKRNRNLQKFATSEACFKKVLEENLAAGYGVTNAEMCVAVAAADPVFAETSPKKQEDALRRFRRRNALSLRVRTGTSQYTAADRDGVTCAFRSSLRSLPRPAVICSLRRNVSAVVPERRQNYCVARGKAMRAEDRRERQKGQHDFVVRHRARALGRKHTTCRKCCPWTSAGCFEGVGTGSKRKNSIAQTVADVKKKAQIDCCLSENGWMTGAIFAKWIHQLADKVHPEQQQVWIVYDHAKQHMGADVESIMNARKFTRVKIPPHATSFLQVHDTHVMKTFHAQFKRLKAKLRVENMATRATSSKPLPYDRLQFALHVAEALALTPVELVKTGVLKHLVSALTEQELPAIPACPSPPPPIAPRAALRRQREPESSACAAAIAPKPPAPAVAMKMPVTGGSGKMPAR